MSLVMAPSVDFVDALRLPLLGVEQTRGRLG